MKTYTKIISSISSACIEIQVISILICIVLLITGLFTNNNNNIVEKKVVVVSVNEYGTQFEMFCNSGGWFLENETGYQVGEVFNMTIDTQGTSDVYDDILINITRE